jgi:hypothetical protein
VTNHSQNKTPNLRLKTPWSPAIRDEFKIFDDVFVAIPVKVDSWNAPVQAKPDSCSAPLSPKLVTYSCSFDPKTGCK